MTPSELHHTFSHHPPQTIEQRKRYIAIREAARELAAVIIDNAPESADRSAAIRKIREAMWSANAAIALNEWKRSETVPGQIVDGFGPRYDEDGKPVTK